MPGAGPEQRPPPQTPRLRDCHPGLSLVCLVRLFFGHAHGRRTFPDPEANLRRSSGDSAASSSLGLQGAPVGAGFGGRRCPLLQSFSASGPSPHFLRFFSFRP